MDIIEITSELCLIPLAQDLPGFTSFIGSWLYKGEKKFLVDVGPASTVPKLLNALEIMGVQRLDAVLLTHIHIDHAGGAGDFVSYFPDTPILCHSSGIPHLEDPSRLWKGSLKTLGETARAYGPIQPVPPGLLHEAEAGHGFHLGSGHEIMPFLTPGHASHHVSYLFDDYLFAGESGGVFCDLPDGRFYLRPATPPRFFMETSIRSIDTLSTVPHKIFCYGHFGMTRNSPQMLETHRRQLFKWADVIREQMRADDGTELVERCMESLLKEDPLLAGWHRMAPDVQKRERTFLHNSIRGFVGYLKD